MKGSSNRLGARVAGRCSDSRNHLAELFRAQRCAQECAILGGNPAEVGGPDRDCRRGEAVVSSAYRGRAGGVHWKVALREGVCGGGAQLDVLWRGNVLAVGACRVEKPWVSRGLRGVTTTDELATLIQTALPAHPLKGIFFHAFTGYRLLT